jgi:hypothetical protein
MLTCAEATNAAVQTVRTMGYTIKEVKRASADAPGLVIGEREKGFAAANPVSGGHDTMKVRVTCSDSGSSFEAVSDEGGLAQLNFPTRFSSTIKKEVSTKTVRLTKPAEEARGLIVKVQPVRPAESMGAFGIDLPGAGVTPVQVEINNRSDRRYSLEWDRVTLVTTQGKREKALTPEEAARAASGGTSGLGAQLREKALVEGEVGAGEVRDGYMYFRASTYRRARVVLIDVESGEPEGVSIGF